jgi:hypothetical protein
MTLSVGVEPGEIVGLLFPPSRPRVPVLRAMAGLDAPVGGEVPFPVPSRVVLATPGRGLSEALSSAPDLVLLEADPEPDRNTWARLASERERGTSFVIATANVEQAYRCDWVALATWEIDDLVLAVRDLALRMTSAVQEFLALLQEAETRRTVVLAADLRRLKAGARALLSEMRRRVSGANDRVALQSVVADVAGVWLDDRVLDAVIAEAQDR